VWWFNFVATAGWKNFADTIGFSLMESQFRSYPVIAGMV
jgi:hypothetical protein